MLKSLPRPQDEQQEKCRDVIIRAADEGFNSVMLIGFRRDNSYCVIASPMDSRLKQIGALEAIKAELLINTE